MNHKKFSLTVIKGWHCHRPIVVEAIPLGDQILMSAQIDGADPIEIRSPMKEGEDVAIEKLKGEIIKAAGTSHKEQIRSHLRSQNEEMEFAENARRNAELNKPR
jgi:hypothetical protein